MILTASVFLLDGCSKSPHQKSLADISEQLTQQFRSQHESRAEYSARKIEAVEATSFDVPTGSPRPYLGITVKWNGINTSTGVPLTQLGDGLFGVTFQDSTTKEELSAIISFR